MSPGRRWAAAAGVALLHVLVVWGFLGAFVPKLTASPPAAVRVSLLPKAEPPPKLPPPVLPHFSLRPVTLPAIPRFTITPVREPPPAPAAPAVRIGPSQPASPPASTAMPPPNYLGPLLAYLNGYKNYPADARRHHEQGTVRLRFKMDRTGRVLSYEVVGSSGHPALDEEARAMIRRAQPLPPPPPNYPGEIFDLVVPIIFSLR